MGIRGGGGGVCPPTDPTKRYRSTDSAVMSLLSLLFAGSETSV